MTLSDPSSLSTDPRRLFAVDVVRTLRAAGYEALWAGGCVRDALLGKVPKDYDVASTATPSDVIALFGERRTVAVGASFGVVMVLGPTKQAGQIEVATFRSDGQYLDGRRPSSVTFCRPEEDAKRRDFTINGLFFDPISEQVIDYVGGRQDLSAGIVRAIGDPHARFGEDKLRMLRAVRFAATFSFSLDAATADAIRAHHHQLLQVSVERIAQELRRMLAHPSRALSIQMMQDTRIIGEALPEICDEHGRLADPQVLPVLNELEICSSESAFAVILRSLINDQESDARVRRKPIEDCCRRLKLSNDELDAILWLIEAVPTIRNITEQPLHVRKTMLAHPLAESLLNISRAIAIAEGRRPEDADFCRNYLSGTPRDVLWPEPFLSGKDVMALGVAPGPSIRLLLERLWRDQLDERLLSRDDAICRLRELVSRQEF